MTTNNTVPRTIEPLALTVEQVAQLLGISVRSVWRLSSAGDFPSPVSIGRSKRWARQAIEAYINTPKAD